MERVKDEEAAGTQTDDDELADGEFYSPPAEDFGPGSQVRAQSTDSGVQNLNCSLPHPSHPYVSSSLGSLPNLPQAENPSRYLSPYECHKDIGRKYVGFATLPKQIQRKCMKKGFEFTLMVVGESGLGKSTLVNTFFLTDLYIDRSIPSVVENIAQTVSIAKKTVSIKEKGVKLRLTIVDTPGFGDSIDNRESWKQVSDYIDQQFEQYRRDETSLNRKNLQDNRVHCCLYFISPFGHGLKPLDVECMRALHEKVNIIPVIAKADSLTQDELALKKARILNEIERYKINIYQIPDADPDEDENLEMKTTVPFAVIGSNSVVDCNGRKIRARVYPWGFVDVENSAHSDFGLLRKMLVMTHMQDLKDTTQDTHYENYRVEVHCKTQCNNKDGSICTCAK